MFLFFLANLNMGSVNIVAHVSLYMWLLFPENELLEVESLSF